MSEDAQMRSAVQRMRVPALSPGDILDFCSGIGDAEGNRIKFLLRFSELLDVRIKFLDKLMT